MEMRRSNLGEYLIVEGDCRAGENHPCVCEARGEKNVYSGHPASVPSQGCPLAREM